MMEESTNSKIKDEFVEFFKQAQYREKISSVAATGGNTLVLDFDDLINVRPGLSIELLKRPEWLLPIISEASLEVIRIEDPSRERPAIAVSNLPDITPLRSITNSRMAGTLIQAVGMVLRCSATIPRMTTAAFRCPENHLTLIKQEDWSELQIPKKMNRPTRCSADGCDYLFFRLSKKESEIVDFQIAVLQETPDELKGGEIPHSFYLKLFGRDMVGSVRPGDRILLTAILDVDGAAGSEFSFGLTANHVVQMGRKLDDIPITREEEAAIREIASQPAAYDRLIESIAPAIKGLEIYKETTLLLIVGSPQKLLPDGTKQRGDINALLVGEPGVAKSELLKYASRLSPRAIYTSGKGSSGVGITAAVVKDKNGMMMLEAGPMVLADLGTCLIDEFSGLKKEDSGNLHEAMEQQTVTIAKAGIYAQLNSRTSVLAAMNPLFGKYDPYKHLLDNIPIDIPLLSRFDLVFVIKDAPDEAKDRALARHIASLYKTSSFERKPAVDLEMLRKYIAYARKINPELTDEAEKLLEDYYVNMRKSAQPGQLAITPRWMTSLIRISTARARVLLHDRVTADDAKRAIELMKYMVDSALYDPNTKQTDAGMLFGKPLSERTQLELALETFKRLSEDGKPSVESKQFIGELEKTGKFSRDQADRMFKTLYRSGQIFETKPGFFSKI